MFIKVLLNPFIYAIFVILVSDQNLLLRIGIFNNDSLVLVFLSSLFGILIYFNQQKRPRYTLFLSFSLMSTFFYAIKSLTIIVYNAGNPFVLIPIILNFNSFCNMVIFTWGKVFLMVMLSSCITNYIIFVLDQLYKKVEADNFFKNNKTMIQIALSIILVIMLLSFSYNHFFIRKNLKRLNMKYDEMVKEEVKKTLSNTPFDYNKHVYKKFENRKHACLIDPEKNFKEFLHLAKQVLNTKYFPPDSKNIRMKRMKFLLEIIDFYEKFIAENKSLITIKMKTFYHELYSYYSSKAITKEKAKKLLYSAYDQLCYLYEKNPNKDIFNFMFSPIHDEFFYAENDLEKLLKIYESKLKIDKQIENLEKNEILSACSLDVISSLAQCYVKLKRYDQAEKFYADLWQYFNKIQIDSKIKVNYKINLLYDKLSTLYDYFSETEIDQITKKIINLLNLSSKNKNSFQNCRDLTSFYSKIAYFFFQKKQWKKAEEFYSHGLKLFIGMDVQNLKEKKILRDFIDYFSSVDHFYGNFENPLKDSNLYVQLVLLYSKAIDEES